MNVDEISIVAIVLSIDHDTIWKDSSAVFMVLCYGDDVPVVVLYDREPVLRTVVVLLAVSLSDHFSEVFL